jgi:ATP-binding cassette, subfamily C (CFTR/MRP), member 1
VEPKSWIKNAKIRDIILFDQPFEEIRYNETIKACQLESDFEILPSGDNTEIGEKGINLSGG